MARKTPSGLCVLGPRAHATLRRANSSRGGGTSNFYSHKTILVVVAAVVLPLVVVDDDDEGKMKGAWPEATHSFEAESDFLTLGAWGGLGWQ